MARAGINLQADFGELAVATGAVRGMAKKVRSDMFAADLVKYTHSVMADRFDMFLDGLGGGTDKSLHHVYEWNTPPGAPGAKLWTHKLIGHGGNRNATWDWRASKKPIPSIDDRAADTSDPMSLVPEDKLQHLSRERHWFHWKAPVMELGNPVLILPKNGRRIVYPTGDPSRPLAFSRGHTVQEPGGRATTGSFTAKWVGWWSTEAPRVFEEVIAPEAESEIARSVRRAARPSSKTIGISSMVNYAKLMENGEDWAEYNIDRYQRNMRLRARRNSGNR